MYRLALFGLCLLSLISLPVCQTPAASQADAATVSIADAHLQVVLDRTTGSLRSLLTVADGSNQLAPSEEPFALWQLTIREGNKPSIIAADQAGPVQIENLTDGRPGLRLTWDAVPLADKRSLRVEATVRLGEPGQCRWEIALTKPADVRVSEIAFPRVPCLKPREHAELAIPQLMGILYQDAEKLFVPANGKGRAMSWTYPGGMSLQCLAYYEPDVLGFYAACDDTHAYCKRFSLRSDPKGRIYFDISHVIEQEAVGAKSYRVPYAVVLGSFRGDWSTAAAIYRESAAAKTWASRARLSRGMVPDWVGQIGAWAWNRGRSQEVLVPAAVMQEYLQAPVSVFWHWWHNCAYDAHFPEYLPPREGSDSFRSAVETAQRKGIHAIVYINQRLWGTTTKSWTEEGAEAFAAKQPDGTVRTEVYNVFMKAPCAPMCLATDFWRAKYASVARDVVCDLKVDGVYMDQACCSPPPCYDSTHGHILGRGRFNIDAFGLLSSTIRDQCAAKTRAVLGGEFCGEPWLPYLDLMLTWDISQERTRGSVPGLNPIPFFHAVYHPSVAMFGNYGSLVQPPYDERWPAEKAPPGQLSLLDRKFARQFYMEQARQFAWGQQPTIPNFLPNLLTDRPEEIDYLKRSVQIRQRTLKYLQRGTWLRPPKLDVPQREIDISKIGTYIKLVESKKQVPAALAGAWRAADGDVGIALATIDDTPLAINLPIDAKAYGLSEGTVVYRTDHTGRQRLGELRQLGPTLHVELPPRAVWILEFSAK